MHKLLLQAALLLMIYSVSPKKNSKLNQASASQNDGLGQRSTSKQDTSRRVSIENHAGKSVNAVYKGSSGKLTGEDRDNVPGISETSVHEAKSQRSFGSVPVTYHLKKKAFKNAAVATNSEFSAELAMDVLRNGGSAADAAIVALLAEGVANPQSMGIGGGFLLTYYDGKTKEVECLNARECAPGLASEHMYSSEEYEIGATVAVPGEIKGYWELHKKYGNLEWKELFAPVIKACREGIPVASYTAGIFKLMKKTIKSSPTLKQLFINLDTSDTYQAGEYMKRTKLADTLEIIAKDGQSALYKGKLTNSFVQDIRNKGGIITTEDMDAYRAKWVEPTRLLLKNNLTIYSVPSPGGGWVLSFIMDIISKLPETDDEVKEWFQIIETWKYAYGFKFFFDGPLVNSSIYEPVYTYETMMSQQVLDLIAKTNRTSDDVRHYTDKYGSSYYGGGTCHICILGPDGSAVSVTSSINSAFGALFVSPSTGIILNNHMMDFNTLDYTADIKPTNRVSGFKQPISNMAPTIILDKTKNICLIIGAAGGSKIITAISQVIYEYLLKNVPLHKALCHKRIHHSLIPMKLRYEDGFPEEIIEGLSNLGHAVKVIKTDAEMGSTGPASSSVCAIGIEHKTIYPYGDPRRNGTALGW